MPVMKGRINGSTQDVEVDAGGAVGVQQAAHDDLNANANLQIANADAAVGNPVPVAGTAADGAVAAGNPVQVGGVDGAANAQALLMDTGGRPNVVGAAAEAAAPAGNPVLMGGDDGAAVRNIQTDTTGRQIAVGAAADGAAVAGNPVLMAGQDGALAQSLLTDSTGRQVAVGAAAAGAAIAGNPLLVALIDTAGLVQTPHVEAENAAAPAAPRGIFIAGRGTTASPAFTNGDAVVPNFDLSGRQRMVNPVPGAGFTVAQVNGTSAGLAGGTNNVTIRTVPANTISTLNSLVCAYAGTVTGVTLVIRNGTTGIEIGIPVGGLVSGQFVHLMRAGERFEAQAAETWQVRVRNATVTDTITFRAHFTERAQ